MPGFILGQWASHKPLAGLHAEGGVGARRGVRGSLQQVRGGGQGGGRDSGESRSLGPEAAWHDRGGRPRSKTVARCCVISRSEGRVQKRPPGL